MLFNRSIFWPIAAVYLIVALLLDGVEGLALMGLFLASVFILIFFADEIGSFTGYTSRGKYIDKETPGCLLSGIGWALIIGAAVVGVIKGLAWLLKS